jgi:hypothetical protein
MLDVACHEDADFIMTVAAWKKSIRDYASDLSAIGDMT